MGYDCAQIGDLLTVSPGEEVRFCDMPNARSPITLTNISSGSVAFKVKTTSPEKFRVKPSAGVVKVGCLVTIELALCEGFSAQQITADKFLLLATPVSCDCLTPIELCKLWKNLPNDQRCEHKLRCAVKGGGGGGGGGAAYNVDMQIRDISDKLECLQERMERSQCLSERRWRAQSRRAKLGLLLAAVLLVAVAADVALSAGGSRGAGYALCVVRRAAYRGWFSWLG